MTNESFILRGDFKKMDRANKYIIIRHFNDSVSVEFMDASNDKALLSQIGCSENAMDYEDLDKFSEYLESFNKPYDKLTEADFIKSIDSTEHNIQFIIEVNSERYVYRNKK